MMNLRTILPRHALYRPDHIAVMFEDQTWTYRAYNARVNRLANLLNRLGLQKGDKVATILPNSIELLDMYWAAAKTGLVIVPMSNLLRGAGLTRLINDSDAKLILTDHTFIDILEPLQPELTRVEHIILTDLERAGTRFLPDLMAAADDREPAPVDLDGETIYNIFYTSGTTGLPKGIMHSHQVRVMYATQYANIYRIMPESKVLHVGALIFNGALLTMLPAFYLGATYCFTSRFNAADTIDLIQTHQITHIKMVPSQIVAILNEPTCSAEALRSLEMLGSVGAPLHLEYKQQLQALRPDIFYELYGLTEGFMTILDRYDFARKMESVGIPEPCTEIKIVGPDSQELPPNEVGEIIGHGPQLMSGYYKRPDLTEKAIRDGWLYSGDLGYKDEDGFLYLVDRQKDMIISGGVNVYPRDIEEVIVQHPAVREAAVFGIPSERWGETPVAAVILKDGETIDPETLKDWINDRVGARFQKVDSVMFKDQFPRSAAGKTLKRVMRQPFWD